MPENFSPKIEKEILKFWKKNKIFEKSVNQRDKKRSYVFYDGPPFATGLPHYGHILASTIKDVVPRYWTMKGYRVERRWGWDCHGLPIEEIAERTLKISGKKQIEKLGIDKFNQFCRSKVLAYAKEWGKTVERIGRWAEFENSYKTMDNSYIESVWWAFKKIWDKGLIYQDKKVLLYCPRCQSPISNFEVAMDNSYKEITEKAPIIRFKIQKSEIEKSQKLKILDLTSDIYFLVWTTTPWTLVGNLALAVNPKIDYTLIKIQNANEYLILARERLLVIKKPYEIVGEFKGKDLLGLEYERLYPEIRSSKKGWYVVDGGEEVTVEEGTGIVHLAMYGEFDYQIVKKYDLPDNQHINLEGRLIQGPKEWLGFYFKDLDKKILEDLVKRDLLYSNENYSHSYPFCWRCGTLLFYNPIQSWFINIQKIKPRLLKLNEKINWHPGHFKHGRFKKGIEGAPDWNVSRNRYWAAPIPVWICEKCRRKECIGSIEELKSKLPIVSRKSQQLSDLHRPYIDRIKFSCPECQGEMSRISEVFDCWFESGSMPFAQRHYPFEAKDWFDSNFPAQFVAEYVAQTRAWFYVMHVISTILFDKPAVENIVTTGTIMAEDGTKMSKSKGNFPDPWILFEKYGVDALRYWLMCSSVMRGEAINLSEKQVDEIYKKLILILWNVYAFFALYAKNNNKLQISKHYSLDEVKKLSLLDKWILAKLHLLNKEIANYMDNYQIVEASRLILNFVNDLSTWYLRRSRERIKRGNKQTIEILANVLLTLSKLIAPFTPFIAEKIYLQIVNCKSRTINKKTPKSIHLCDYPKFNKEIIDEKLLKDMDKARKICEFGHALRIKAGIKVRQPLQKLQITNYKLQNELLSLVKNELNVKEIEIVEKVEQKKDWLIQRDKDLEVGLDIFLTDQLIEEGKVREIVRLIQDTRKKLNCKVDDRIEIFYQTADPKEKTIFKKFEDYLRKEILAKKISEQKLDKKRGEKIKFGKTEIGIRVYKN